MAKSDQKKIRIRLKAYDHTLLDACAEKIVETANLDLFEALKTFNMGIGMALICSSEDIAAITRHFLAYGRVYRIGEVVRADDPQDSQRVLYKTKTERQ